ncbi:MAG: asparagine synthase-related protein [Salinigranum sp.]
MVGICGALGAAGELTDAVADWTSWRDSETDFSYADERVELALSCHSILAGDQPARVDDGDTLVWLWGDVYGHGTGREYVPRDGPSDGSAAFCARLYEDRGIEFVSELNGEYALVVYDREEGTVTFVTDRFATRPVYYAKPGADEFVFASNLQALPFHPSVEAAFDPSLLQEYLQLRRVFGLETPLVGVRELHPASVVTVDLEDLSMERWTYWRPHYDPVDRPFSYYVDRIVDTLERVLSEWTRDDLEYGMLLSGGSDSRLVQACMDRPVVSFHNADWMSREARIARRVTETSGDEFRLLERYDDHEARSLETTPALSTFSGWFDQAYFTEFEDEIVDEVDVLVSGLFADMLFDGGSFATRSLSLGSIGTVSVPVRRSVGDLDDYVASKLADSKSLPYATSDRSLADVLRERVERTEDGYVSHGVRYGSLTDLVMYGEYYPLSADTEAIFSRSLVQMCPYRTPFLDNRMIDVHRRIPIRYYLRRNLVNAAVGSVDPDLAAIPHARTGVALTHSFPVEYVGMNLCGFLRKHVYDEPTPERHFDHEPWPNRRELLRTHPFAIDAIRENEELIRRLPFLDYEGAEEAYRAHLAGEDNHTILYSLLTLLEMPVTELAPGRSVGGDSPSPPPAVTDGSRNPRPGGRNPGERDHE